MAKVAKFDRSTQQQLQFYIKFCQNHAEFKCGKGDLKKSRLMNQLWQKLAKGLNEMKGPTRKPNKWRDTLRNWKNQLKTRARRFEKLTDGEPCAHKNLSDFEIMALSTFSLADKDQSNNATAKNCSNVAIREVASPTSSTSSVPLSVISSAPTSLATIKSESAESSLRDSPVASYSFKSSSQVVQELNSPRFSSAIPERQKKIKVEEMYAVILESIQKRDKDALKREEYRAERDKKLLVILENIATSLSDLVKKLDK